MWPFRKQKPAKDKLTLKGRVDGFWQWFASNAGRFYATIEDKRCSDLSTEVSEAVDHWLPGMAWVFGVEENEIGHSFTLSGEGILAKQFVTEYWRQRAPKLNGWSFYSARQPSSNPDNFTIQFGDGESFKPAEFWVSTYVDEQAEKIDIDAWHPTIHRLDDRTRFMALFLVLDEILGEHGTQNWIGEIRFSEASLKQAAPVTELRDLIHEIETSKGWQKHPPTETYSSYHLNEQDKEWLRSDTVAGTTRGFVPLRDYLNAQGSCEHPLPELGLDYVFVAIDSSYFPCGSEVTKRGEIEDEIIAQFETDGYGLSLGGATGSRKCYMDFAIYDGETSLSMIAQTLKRHQVPKGTAINYFTTDKAHKSISI